MTHKEATQVLKLCDKLDFYKLMYLGAYLIACAFHKRKPTIGSKV